MHAQFMTAAKLSFRTNLRRCSLINSTGATSTSEIATMEDSLPLQNQCFNVFYVEINASINKCQETLNKTEDSKKTVKDFIKFNKCYQNALVFKTTCPASANGHISSDFAVTCASDFFFDNSGLPAASGIPNCVHNYTHALRSKLWECKHYKHKKITKKTSIAERKHFLKLNTKYNACLTEADAIENHADYATCKSFITENIPKKNEQALCMIDMEAGFQAAVVDKCPFNSPKCCTTDEQVKEITEKKETCDAIDGDRRPQAKAACLGEYNDLKTKYCYTAETEQQVVTIQEKEKECQGIKDSGADRDGSAFAVCKKALDELKAKLTSTTSEAPITQAVINENKKCLKDNFKAYKNKDEFKKCKNTFHIKLPFPTQKEITEICVNQDLVKFETSGADNKHPWDVCLASTQATKGVSNTWTPVGKSEKKVETSKAGKIFNTCYAKAIRKWIKKEGNKLCTRAVSQHLRTTRTTTKILFNSSVCAKTQLADIKKLEAAFRTFDNSKTVLANKNAATANLDTIFKGNNSLLKQAKKTCGVDITYKRAKLSKKFCVKTCRAKGRQALVNFVYSCQKHAATFKKAEQAAKNNACVANGTTIATEWNTSKCGGNGIGFNVSKYTVAAGKKVKITAKPKGHVSKNWHHHV